MVEIDVNAMMFLKVYGSHLSDQQYQALREKLLAGDPQGAMQDLRGILERKQEEV